MTLEDHLERLANRTPPSDAADVLTAARARAESPPDSHSPRFLAAAAVIAVVALAAAGLALAGQNGSDSVTVAGSAGGDMASEVTVPESGASAQQLADGTPVWVVRHDDGSVSVLDAVSTHQPFGAGTLVGWCDSSRGFLDPMYGSLFDEHGRSQAGPAPRGLDSYPVASVDGDTAAVTGSPVEQPRAAEGGPDASEHTGTHCLDEASAPVEGYLSGSFDLHRFDSETPVSAEDAVRQPDGTLVLIDAPVVIVKGAQPLVCTSQVGGSPPACEGVPAPQMFLHDQTAAVLRGPFIARPAGGALTEIAYVGERTIAGHPPAATEGPTDFSDCPGRPSGSSAATFEPAAGTYAAQSLAVEEGRRLRFDIVQWLSGEEANEAYFQQEGDASGAPNDYFIRNDSTEVRSAPVADDADIYVLRADGYADSLHPVSLTDIPTDDPDRTFWLTFTIGSITGICQQYRP